jgi:hypothetical protein
MIWDAHSGSRIRIFFPLPDPGVKKSPGSRIPDPENWCLVYLGKVSMFWRTVRLEPNSGLLEVPRSLVCRVTEQANALERKKRGKWSRM